MNSKWAEENLQTIRTLMERSALYRRALAPIMLFAGVMGILAAAVGLYFHVDSPRGFIEFWLGTAVVVVIGALLIARRQAFKDREDFWSSPTRRVAGALAPPLAGGLILGWTFWVKDDFEFSELLPFIWPLFYGCALHSAGFFMRRGVRWFGWIYIALVPCIIIAILAIMHLQAFSELNPSPHWLMGFFFGVLNLVYGAYLFFTEKGKNAA
jgi:hypothetical protein